MEPGLVVRGSLLRSVEQQSGKPAAHTPGSVYKATVVRRDPAFFIIDVSGSLFKTKPFPFVDGPVFMKLLAISPRHIFEVVRQQGKTPPDAAESTGEGRKGNAADNLAFSRAMTDFSIFAGFSGIADQTLNPLVKERIAAERSFILKQMPGGESENADGGGSGTWRDVAIGESGRGSPGNGAAGGQPANPDDKGCAETDSGSQLVAGMKTDDGWLFIKVVPERESASFSLAVPFDEIHLLGIKGFLDHARKKMFLTFLSNSKQVLKLVGDNSGLFEKIRSDYDWTMLTKFDSSLTDVANAAE